jgi:uracil-DNA glycosylase
VTLDWSVDALVARDEIDESWADAFRSVEPTLIALARDLSGTQFFPHPDDVFRAFRTPLDEVRVLLLGQDPYPTPGHAMGLAFSVGPDVRPLPGSLRNIFTELVDDLATAQPRNGDLTVWATRRVLLLNRTLTVSPGEPMSHRGRGWSEVTDAALWALVNRSSPLVALAWGREAQSAIGSLGNHASVRVIESAHPSPLSASRGFFGSRPFSRANAALVELGVPSIEWSLDNQLIEPEQNKALTESDERA